MALVIGALSFATVLGLIRTVSGALRAAASTLAVVTLAAAVTIEEFGFNQRGRGVEGISGAARPAAATCSASTWATNAAFLGI